MRGSSRSPWCGDTSIVPTSRPWISSGTATILTSRSPAAADIAPAPWLDSTPT
ncbi:hypothetical protein [Aeromicrobium sp. UC242_57]|uniref:hypothetical protein n=1 Tax=Aeromicrobium sp. UC242_57 TaxID=3374624 RepID=UPI0037A3B587